MPRLVTVSASSVALNTDGSLAIVGAESHTAGGEADGGAAYVFSRNGSGYAQTAELTASDAKPGDALGYSVALSADGSTLLVGAPGRSGGGAAYIFSQNDSGYTQGAELRAGNGATGDGFGYSVALSTDGSIALVGAVYSVVQNTPSGAAFIFSRGSAGYTQTAELTASDPTGTDYFGSGVALSADGTSALVGAPLHAVSDGSIAGAAYVFNQVAGGYAQGAELTAADGADADYFGSSVALSADGSIALVGAPLRTVHNVPGEGAAYIFNRDSTGYSQGAELTASGAGAGDGVGGSVALSSDGSAALLGAVYHLVHGVHGGSAYFFAAVAATTVSMSLDAGTNPSHYGDALTISAHVTPASGPSGSVTFWDGPPNTAGSVDLGNSALSDGEAAMTTSALPSGDHHIYAVYSGDVADSGSEGSLDQTVVTGSA